MLLMDLNHFLSYALPSLGEQKQLQFTLYCFGTTQEALVTKLACGCHQPYATGGIAPAEELRGTSSLLDLTPQCTWQQLPATASRQPKRNHCYKATPSKRQHHSNHPGPKLVEFKESFDLPCILKAIEYTGENQCPFAQCEAYMNVSIQLRQG